MFFFLGFLQYHVCCYKELLIENLNTFNGAKLLKCKYANKCLMRKPN